MLGLESKIRNLMTLKALLSVAMLVSSPALSAVGASESWTADAGGMPRCVSFGSWSIVFDWDARDTYSRKIRFARAPLTCTWWSALERSSKAALVWKMEGAEPFPQGLPVEVLARLEQVRQGGNVYHSERDGKSYLAAHPIRQFTIETNRDLARQFGKGFAGEVYQAWVESEDGNARFRAQYLKLMDAFQSHAIDERQLTKKARGLHALVSMGLGWEEELSPSMPSYVRNFVTEIQETGVDTTILHRQALGTLEENIAMLVPQIEAKLRAGEDIVLLGLCKGSTEMLAAASRILSPYLDSQRTQKNRPRGYGRIVAVINLSAMLRGTFFADFVGGIKGTKLLGKVLRELPVDSLNEAGDYERSLPSITVKHLEEVRQSFIENLPSDAIYVDVAGVVTGNGLIQNDTATMRSFQEMDRSQHLAVGASDGFIEYPGNVLPDWIASDHATLIFNGTHMLTDGTVGPYDLSEAKTRLNAYRALYLSVLSQTRNRLGM